MNESKKKDLAKKIASSMIRATNYGAIVIV